MMARSCLSWVTRRTRSGTCTEARDGERVEGGSFFFEAKCFTISNVRVNPQINVSDY